ncbi:MAG: S-layer homology domain-containing protein [Treponemataceae bacterium]|nr:S-layer homology domain-containing protein [Treponemataceae bacterium]
MKKGIFTLFIISLFTLILSSCMTLQDDIYYSSLENDISSQSVSYYENIYVQIDVKYCLDKSLDQAQITSLIETLEMERNSFHMEPASKARLCALEGNLLCLTGKKAAAQDLYKTAKGLQSSDPYVHILSVKLERNKKKQLERLDEILDADEKHSLADLEKAKIYYEQNEYDLAVASIDKALIILKAKGKDFYVQEYSKLKSAIWNESKRSGYEQVKKQNLTAARLVELAQANSDCLYFISGGKKLKTNDLIKALDKGFYFSAATDSQNENKTSNEILKAQYLNRKLCARFLWNIYIQNNRKYSSKTKYSDMFSQNSMVKSPIADLEISDPDFDAVMGCIENEIINLSDGRNFYPEKIVSEAEFVDFLLHLRH